MNPIITIDGPAGAGKSTISRLLAKKTGYIYLDTGAMYRAVAFQAHRTGISFDRGEALRKMCNTLDLHIIASCGEDDRIYIGEEDISLVIRSPEMDMLSSRISAVKEVREVMTALQRKLGRKGGLVAEGRDMGTVVFPNAEYKFFLTASLAVRARRRFQERIGRGETVSFEDIERELKKRDAQDRTRIVAPLRPAEDAIIIDTTNLDVDQVLKTILIELPESEIQDTSKMNTGS